MMPSKISRVLRRVLGAGRSSGTTAEIFARQRHELARAMTLVRVFYVATAYQAVHGMQSWVEWTARDELFLIWPVAWMDCTGVSAGVPIVLVFQLMASLFASVWPTVVVCRVAVTIGLLMTSALVNSLAGAVVVHGWHAWIWIAAWFVFLPSGSDERIMACRARSQRFLRVFWSAQVTVLFFYSLGGVFKLAGACVQALQGHVHAFCPEALARHTAFRLLEGAESPPYLSMGPWLVEHPGWGILVFPLSIYLEVFAFVVAFRPEIQRAWAAALIGMHLGIYSVMTILFSTQVLMLGLMLLTSPWAARQASSRDLLRAMPLVGDIRYWCFGRRSMSPR